MKIARPYPVGEIGTMEFGGPFGYTWDTMSYLNFKNEQAHWPWEEIEPQVVLDVGANQGFCAWDYARKWPKAMVYGVEMHPESARIAASNVGTRGLVFNVAVAGTEGEKHYDGDMHTVYHLAAYGNVIEGVTLEGICKQVGRPIDFVKMDIEGAEWEVLSAQGWEQWIATMLIELHPQYLTYEVDALLELIANRGYTVSVRDGMAWAVRVL